MHLTLLTLLTLALSITAIPTTDPTPDSINANALAARAGCSKDVHPWEGGGCEWKWGGDCIERCVDQSAKQKCCSGTVTSHEDSSGCAWGWQTCQCRCKQKK